MPVILAACRTGTHNHDRADNDQLEFVGDLTAYGGAACERSLDNGELPARLVGRHRRIRFGDLLDYKRRTDAAAHQAADDLIELSEEMGLYD